MTVDFAHRSDIQGFARVLAVAVRFVCSQNSTLYLAGNACVPNIGSNDVDAFDHRPEDGRTDLGLCREPYNEEGAARTEIVNRLLVRSALYISG
jgi:hypothetical protein